ncbi:hypothetical protein K227x_55990 [Rubripirellula lacrimiformis]|uniref:Uncharacterized protein n=1 Tax=Rubripirellula lacrimiformis TaxID=1930273 RepID=A0A517NJ69_9BACT|nr:hypothetical protein [Rubripirellula lacrimiformis]QDT07174.1 hypothetical protein K227x_55990 [Rubripirellula lacrimiformis]
MVPPTATEPDDAARCEVHSVPPIGDQSLIVNDDGSANDAVIASLQGVVSDVDDFMSSWLERLSQSDVLCQNPLTTDQRLRERIERFEREKSRWEDKRRCQEREIHQKLDQLSDAWLRLESEQRRFLQTKGSRHPIAVANNAAIDDGVEKNPVPISGKQSVNEQVSSPRSVEATASEARESAVLQFQRLRQEIEFNRPSSGAAPLGTP